MTQTITRRRARAIIAERLDDLGHAPDFIEDDAVEALLARSQRSPQALHAALAATLFLASTEDAIQVGRDLVDRAVPAGIQAEAPPVRRPARWAFAGGLAMLAFAGLALLLPHHMPSPPAPVPPRKAATPAVPPANPAPRSKPAVVPAPLSPAPPLPAPPPQTSSTDPKVDLTRAVAADLAGDSTKAFRLYLGAAAAGLPEAQFDTAVKYDSGRGAPRSAPDAALYYAFAASNGHAMAAYNLGLLYQSGDGVPRNPALAQAWFQAAARDGLRQTALPPSTSVQPGQAATVTPPDAPTPLYPSAGTVIRPVQDFVPLVWAAPAGPAPVHYEIQVTTSQDGSPHDVLTQNIDVSATRVPVGRKRGQYAWRVVAVGPGGSAAAGWVHFSVGG